MKGMCVAVAAAAVVGAAWTVGSVAQTAQKLEGTWTGVSAERDGKPADELKGHRLTLAGNTFVIQREAKTLYKGTFKADPSRKPGQIDFHHTDGELKGQTWQGIYALDGDTLRIADNAPDLTKPRPAQLAAKASSGHVLLVFKRAAR
jgi:uncharacterized protein (TIGR03067 family)